jgi:hypothetical protein
MKTQESNSLSDAIISTISAFRIENIDEGNKRFFKLLDLLDLATIDLPEEKILAIKSLLNESLNHLKNKDYTTVANILEKKLTPLLDLPEVKIKSSVEDRLLRVFIGCDPRQPITYNIMQYSITSRSSVPVQIAPLYINQLPITRQGLTPFTYTRFLVPWLCNYQGWALFTDADMLVTADIAELFNCADDQYDLMVVKNPERFEWASVMLFNCSKCTALTPDYVQNAPTEQLFGMTWKANNTIGELPSEWNHLVGYSVRRNDAKLVHFTQGSPMFPEIGVCEYSAEWFSESMALHRYSSWQEIMGPSVHATWLSGKLVPKLTVTDKINEVIKNLANEFVPIPPNENLPYSRNNPSIKYQIRINQFLVRHLSGSITNQQQLYEIDSGFNLLQIRETLQQFVADKNITTLLDYGAGKTNQYAPLSINTEKGNEHFHLQQFLKLKEIKCYDPGYPPISDLAQQTVDCVVCCDVLDRCPEEDLLWIISEIFSLAEICVFIKINHWDNGVKLNNDEPEVCVIKPKEWWVDLISTVRKAYPDLIVSLILQTTEQGQIEDISTMIK